MKSFKFGHTRQGLPIFGHRFNNGGPKTLILGGVHGNEYEGVAAAEGLLDQFMQNFTYKLDLTIVPCFNPEGVLLGERKNSAGVDLNRNLPTNDWTSDVAEEKYFPGTGANSEPENQALVDWLAEHKPKFVLSLHSWKPLINVNGSCGPEAEVLNKHTGYEIKESIGYPTPGCLGTYCGLERNMPTITYEVERFLPIDKIIKTHVPAIKEALKATENRI